ncbi:MAG: hypothetical protein RR383_09620, partial [Muribaculaceae bacterium]
GAGLEPAQPQWPKDFKSFVSTIPPSEQLYAFVGKHLFLKSGAKINHSFRFCKYFVMLRL